MAKRGWCGLAIVALVACSKAKETSPAASGSAASPVASVAGSAAPAGSAAAVTAGSGSIAAAGAAAADGSAATAGSAAGSGAGSATEGYKVGDIVYGMWTNGQWYPGKIGKINDDGTYRVNYNDGDVSRSLTLKKIKPRKASVGRSGGGGGKSTASTGGAQPCPASHWTRCGNNCYLLTDDRYNCGRCGNACPSNKSICRNGTCDCTGVEKDSNGGVCP